MTKEEVEQAFNGLSPYYAYKQGVQDGIAYNEESFRREAAKDMVCAILSAGMNQTDDNNEHFHTFERLAEVSVEWADALIAKLKEQ